MLTKNLTAKFQLGSFVAVRFLTYPPRMMVCVGMFSWV